jgi:gamma-glutamylcyclotransferase (GGCT)/AIG2-like uncharacterized protein YtfP
LTSVMPHLFSYGTLQQEDVQLATLGRRLDGEPDDLIGYEPSLVKIEELHPVAESGKTHHANVRLGEGDGRVAGMVFEVTDAELARIDEYEMAFSYQRVVAKLASGKKAWVYRHVMSQEDHIVNTLELDRELNEMIEQGKSVDAFRKFYHEDVVAQENDDPERVGRDSWMLARLDMEKKLKRFSARVLANAANGDVSFSEWEFDMEMEGMGAMKMVQVAVRRWKDGKVVRERFYHK